MTALLREDRWDANWRHTKTHAIQQLGRPTISPCARRQWGDNFIRKKALVSLVLALALCVRRTHPGRFVRPLQTNRLGADYLLASDIALGSFLVPSGGKVPMSTHARAHTHSTKGSHML